MTNFTVCSKTEAPHMEGHINACFNPSDYSTIYEIRMKESRDVKRSLCISHGKNKVYKLYRGMNLVPQGMVALDYESLCNLGVSEGDKVSVRPISKLCYSWHTSDSLAKISFIIAILSIILGVIALI